MTRKDYNAIAAAIKNATPERKTTKSGKRSVLRAQSGVIADNIADALAEDNPNFDRERFLRACGVE